MTQAAAAWRVTYTPGNWLVLSGPTTLVVMLPAPARASDLVGELWRDILAAGSVDALLRLAAEVGLDAMPDFGAFFWDEAGLHGLTRGSVRVLDADTGEVALEGSGAVTWNEAPLGAERRLRIDLEPVDRDEMLQLPLVVGAACVSTIHLSTAPDALVSFPTREQGDLVTPPARAAAPEAEEPDADAVADLAAAITSPPTEDAPRDQAEEPAEEEPIPPAEPAPESATPDALTPEMSAAEMPAPGAGLLGVPGGPLPGVPTPGGPLPGVPGPLAAAVPVPPPAPPVGQRGAPVVVAPTLGEVDEDDGGTIFSTGLAATHKPAANERVGCWPCPASTGTPTPPGRDRAGSARAPSTRRTRG